MISVPVASNDIAFRNQLSIFWDNHKLIYGDDAYKKAHAIIVSQNSPEQNKIKDGEWGLDIPSTVVEPYWSHLQREHSRVLLPINIQSGLSQIINNFDDDELLELIDCDMFHIKAYEEQEINEDEFLVCDIYEDWHLKSKSDLYGVIENFLDKDQSAYNGGFVPIIGYVKTFKKILKYWTDVHLQIFDSTDDTRIQWWSGMYSLQVACANNGIKMKAIDNCYIPSLNELKDNHHIAHYCCDTVFSKNKELRKPDKFDYTGFPSSYFYDQIKNWMKKMNSTKNDGKILFQLPEPLVEKPLCVESFFSEEMLVRVKDSVKDTGVGTDRVQFHTMQGRWYAQIGFDEDIEDFILNRARTIFNDESLQKSYFLAARYQRKDGCIPHLWEHVDQNGTQLTLDIAIDNSANWGLVVEGEHFEQKPNDAIAFCGQQHTHGRPPYPTIDEEVFTTVLFLHFTQPEHWIQKDRNLMNTYSRDGVVRFFNRNRYFPLPDAPINQPVCSCCDFSGVLNFYDEITGHRMDEPSETVDMSVTGKIELAPGIMKYTIPEESARILKGLIQNSMLKQWQPAEVYSKNDKAEVDQNARNCYNYFISEKELSCHPQDPIRRAAESLKSGLDGIVEDFRSRYSIVPLKSHHTVLLRYEEGNKFSNHIDAHPEFPRVVSVSMFLNDDFEGGDLEFKEFGIKIKPDAGDVIVFCSSFPYMHQVHPVEIGIRYAVVKWYQWT